MIQVFAIYYRLIQMEKSDKENPFQIFIHDTNEQVGYFDRDKTEATLPTTKQLPLSPCGDKQLLDQLQNQIAHSRSNFFKVDIAIEEKPNLITKYSQPTKSLKELPEIPSIKSSKSFKQKEIVKKKDKYWSHISMEGFLEKKYDSNIFFKWYTRYVVLTSEKMYLFQDKSKQNVLACFNFKVLPAELINSQNPLEIKISFQQQCEDLILRAPNNTTKIKWVKTLESVIQRNSESKKVFMMTKIKPLYQNTDTITQDEFQRIAETGDILLFLTDHTSGKIQRMLTSSDYDHVAMVIRVRGDLMVFQANQGDGVALYRWKKFVRYFNLYKKITFRKLKSWRKKQLHECFLNFAKKNIGKKFDIGAYKLLFKQESDFDWTQQKEADRGYFCSELIAKALKSGGLLDLVKASSRYWPVDFSQGSKSLPLIGATLGPEQSIILDKFIKNIV